VPSFPRDAKGRIRLFHPPHIESEKADIAEGLDAGADDFLTKPVSAPELRARINAGARILSMERELSDKNRQISEALDRLQEAHDAVDRDLRQARTIQESLIPERSRVFGNSRVSLLLKPCGHVGGDLVGMFCPDHDRLGLYSIDVSGHGITSAMVTARVSGYLSSSFPDQNLALEKRFGRFHALRPPAETLRLLNERFTADPGVEEYLTMAYANCDLASGRVRLVQAGHPPPILLHTDGRISFLGSGGLPIGLVEQVSHDEIECRLAPGDRLLFYSDGFSEAVLRCGEMLGEEGLAGMFRAAAGRAEGIEVLEDMFWALTEAMGPGSVLGDDVSAALLEYDMVARG
jgi:sigma-B regulation protein RsbU (phosphoserine phosphatase)